jgi:hypothetical protein
VVILCLDERYRATLARCAQTACAWTSRRATVGPKRFLAGQADACLSLIAFYPVAGVSRACALKRINGRLRVVAVDKGDPDSRCVALAAGADAVVSPALPRDEVMRAIRVAQGPGRR